MISAAELVGPFACQRSHPSLLLSLGREPSRSPWASVRPASHGRPMPEPYPPAKRGCLAMLTIHGPKTRFCDGVSRRSFLQIGALGMAGAGLNLANIFRSEA